MRTKRMAAIVIAAAILSTGPSARATGDRPYTLTQPLYESIGTISEGVAPAYNNGLWGYIDLTGEYVLEPKYVQAEPFSEGLAFTVDAQGATHAYIDKTGARILTLDAFQDQWTGGEFSDATAPIWLTNDLKTRYIDRQGQTVLIYDGYARSFHDGLAVAYAEQGYTYIDKQGKSTGALYDECWDFSNGRAVVLKNGKYGVIDTRQRYIIPAIYDDVSDTDLTEGVLCAKKDGYWIALSLSGAVIQNYQLKIITGVVGGFTFFMAHVYFMYQIGTTSGPPLITDGWQDVRSAGDGFVYRKGGLCGMLIPDDLPEYWAVEEVGQAEALDLVPADMRTCYLLNISREDFCRMAVALVEKHTGMTAQAYIAQRQLGIAVSFPDTDRAEIVAAAQLGIVKGRTSGKFDPYAPITRQEAAAMLARTARLLGAQASSEPYAFIDRAKVDTWATEDVDLVSALGVMKGNTVDEFMPLSPYTREQSYMTIARLYNALNP